MFCSECGSSNKDSARFCQSCGTVIDESHHAKVVANVATEVSNEKVKLQSGSLRSLKWLLPVTAISIALGVALALIFISSTSHVVTTAVHAYTLGETGPGGGTVFYYSTVGFNCGQLDTATGSPTGGLCHYLEAAPTTAPNAWVDAPYAWSGNTTGSIGTTRTAIGSGYANTLAMIAQDATAGMAGTVSRAYSGPNNLSDWFLPSRDELNQLCKYASGQPWTSDATVCNGSQTPSLGLMPFPYWSSFEIAGYGAWYQTFRGGNSSNAKANSLDVRPVRAF